MSRRVGEGKEKVVQGSDKEKGRDTEKVERKRSETEKVICEEER